MGLSTLCDHAKELIYNPKRTCEWNQNYGPQQQKKKRRSSEKIIHKSYHKLYKNGHKENKKMT